MCNRFTTDALPETAARFLLGAPRFLAEAWGALFFDFSDGGRLRRAGKQRDAREEATACGRGYESGGPGSPAKVSPSGLNLRRIS